jgi:hypothetical protein
VERNRKAGQNPPRVVAPIEVEEELESKQRNTTTTMHPSIFLNKNEIY